MLGPVRVRALDQPTLVSLEALVPADHFYRQLDRTLDLSFVRDLVRDRYAAGGRPAIDPVVFFRLQLVLLSVRFTVEGADRHFGQDGYTSAADRPPPGDAALPPRERRAAPARRARRGSDAGLALSTEPARAGRGPRASERPCPRCCGANSRNVPLE